MKTLGIDCGVNGAFALLENNRVKDAVPYPIMSDGKRNVPLSKEVFRLIKLYEPDIIIIEDTGGHAPSASGLRSMTSFYQCALTCSELYNECPIWTPISRKWQAQYWSGKVENTKKSAKGAVSRLFPEAESILSRFNKKIQEGIVDAILIANYKG